jgi:maleate isomerase
MYRFGLILPSTNIVMEPELWHFCQGFATLHVSRMRIKEVSPKGLEAMEKEALDAALRLADAKMDVIGYGCTSGSFYRGIDHDKELVKEIEKATGTPTVVTSGVVVEALKALGVRRVSVATPYIDEVNALEKAFLEGHGLRVDAIEGLGYTDPYKIGIIPSSEAFRLGKDVYASTSDALFLSCTDLKTFDILDKLEKEIGRPVISSNSATLWGMMKRLKIQYRIEGLGRLLRTIPKDESI